MNFTKYFNLNKAEASDKFNELTINNPAMDKVDAQLYKNQNSAVQPAEHSKIGNVHNIVKSISESIVLRFIATSDFIAGDSFTIDGQPIIGRMSDGRALQTNAFRTGNNVLAIHSGGILTILVANQIEILDMYPVGSIYMATNSVSPATLFGGNWRKIEDTFIVASGSKYPLGSSGGAENHNHLSPLTLSSGATICVSADLGVAGINTKKGYEIKAASSQLDVQQCYTTGNSSNIPPYLSVSIWERTA